MQVESHNLSPIFERIDRIRIKTNRSWDEMAKLLDIDRSMFFHVKKGRRNLSKKAIFRLKQVENDAGMIQEVASIDAGAKEPVNSHEEKITISASDHPVNLPERLARLKKAKTLGWSELADLLEIKRSMLHYLRKGERSIGFKTLRKLQSAEQEVGLKVPEFSEGSDLKIEQIGESGKFGISLKAKDLDELRTLVSETKSLLLRIEKSLEVSGDR